jgi:tRNA pseudouridine38-40 synthase
MPRFRFEISYDGSEFSGWQKQIDTPTIQGEIEDKIRMVTQISDIDLVASGRTDSGVHARAQVAHLDLDLAESPDRLKKRLNSVLPKSIRIRHIENVDDDFHARFNAISRTYHYSIATSSDPLQPLRWNLMKSIDPKKLLSAAEDCIGTHDFRPFALMDPVLENCVCTITESRFEETRDGYVYIITGNRFLRNMVRRLVGMMVAIAAGEVPEGSIRKTLEGHPPQKVPSVAPAHGLVLERVSYVDRRP